MTVGDVIIECMYFDIRISFEHAYKVYQVLHSNPEMNEEDRWYLLLKVIDIHIKTRENQSQ